MCWQEARGRRRGKGGKPQETAIKGPGDAQRVATTKAPPPPGITHLVAQLAEGRENLHLLLRLLLL